MNIKLELEFNLRERDERMPPSFAILSFPHFTTSPGSVLLISRDLNRSFEATLSAKVHGRLADGDLMRRSPLRWVQPTLDAILGAAWRDFALTFFLQL